MTLEPGTRSATPAVVESRATAWAFDLAHAGWLHLLLKRARPTCAGPSNNQVHSPQWPAAASPTRLTPRPASHRRLAPFVEDSAWPQRITLPGHRAGLHGGSAWGRGRPVGFGRTIRSMNNQPSALARSLETARGLKPGTWDGVEALSILAMEARGLPDGPQLLATAQETASRLKSGSWEAVRALAWLNRAERELADAVASLE